MPRYSNKNAPSRYEARKSTRVRRRRRFPVGPVVTLLLVAALIAAGVIFWNNGTLPRLLGLEKSTPAPASGQSDPTATPEPTPTAEPTAEPTPSPTPEPVAPAIFDDGTDGYMSAGLCIYNKQAFELFYGSDSMAESYAELINGFADALPGMQVYNMVVPNHSEFGLPERVRNFYDCMSQRQNTTMVYENLSEKVKPVDVYDALNLHNNENIYFGTDTHWAPLGAYYAYEKFCEVAGVSAVPLSGFEKTTYEDYTGYLYTATGESVLAENPDTLDVYDPRFDFTAEMSYDGLEFFETDYINMHDADMGYAMYLSGDMGVVHVTNNDSAVGRKLAIVKDSYGNAISPFLMASFDEVYVIDFRYFSDNLPLFLSNKGVTDVLFFNNVMSANTSSQHETMQGLF